jgi:hypothetical protein
MFAEHDATANAIAYVVTLLAMDVRLQEWLREEIVSILGGEVL